MYSLLFGLAGGLVGVVTWGAVVFFGGRHVGWFAFVVGVLVGMGIRCGAVGALGTDQGEIAVAIALPCILLGKYAGAHGMASRLRLIEIDDNFMTSILADRIVKARQATGQRMVWPPEKNQTGAPLCLRYPTEIWSEAERKCLPPNARPRCGSIKMKRKN